MPLLDLEMKYDRGHILYEDNGCEWKWVLLLSYQELMDKYSSHIVPASVKQADVDAQKLNPIIKDLFIDLLDRFVG